MIVLDTNVLSESLRPTPDEAVLRWLSRQNRDHTYITAITLAEVLHRVEVLPGGRRRNRLRDAVERLFQEEFAGRVLAFDDEAAIHYPKIVAGRAALGRPISQFDAVIAAICLARHATIATRNTRDFEHCGIAIVNPWDEQ